MDCVSFVSQKGGSSKSTLAAHMAVVASESMSSTMLDADPQKSLTAWWHDREPSQPALMDMPLSRLETKLRQVADEVGFVAVDTQGAVRASITPAIALSTLVIIPVKPSPLDLWSARDTLQAVKAAGKPFLFVITQAVAGSVLLQQTRERLADVGPVADTVMHSRVAYVAAMTVGQTAMEMQPHGRAATEMRALFKEITQALQKGRKRNGR